ncbi:pantetheine-phosphate adenylyltransferase [Candidatus Beckwithbacteria bacterium]|nr:pantetheine-phosphate adenylyltransferase [Candidatus Beckwithbacteria bacterium]
MNKYQFAALGGTFDHLHKGHQTLLTHAFSVAEKVAIGITRNGMNSHKDLAFAIQDFELRKADIEAFANERGWQNRFNIVELHDMYGPTLDGEQIDCLVVSPLTKPGAEAINQKRQELDKPVLPIEVCHLEESSDGQHISSTRIREGEIDRDGFVYRQIFDHDLAMSDMQKQILKEPLGELIRNPDLEQIASKLDTRQLNVAIGDISSLYAHQNNLPVQVYVFDKREQRQNLETSVDNFLQSPNLITCQNPAGTISQELVSALQSGLTHRQHLKIDGEEDLALLPAILFLPLGSTILYGQPNQGIVLVTVTEEKKQWCKELLI